MRLAPAARRQSLDQFRQLSRRRERSLYPVMHNRPRKPPRFPFVTVFPKNLRDLFRAFRIQQRRRRHRLPRIHSHVQRAVVLKTETALGHIKLRTAHTEIQKTTIATPRRNPFAPLRVIPAPQFKPSRKLRQPFGRRFKRDTIAVARQQSSVRRARGQHCCGVPSPTERSVGVLAARLRLERCQHFRHHHGLV